MSIRLVGVSLEDVSLVVNVNPRRRRLGRGETLWRQGDAPDALAVVVNGSLHVTRTSERGETLLLRILRPFDVVGLSAVAGAAQSADLIAGEPSTVLVLPGRRLRGLFCRASGPGARGDGPYLTHAELAAQVGASRANVSRALGRLRRRGAVQCGRRRITIVDVGA